MMFEDKEQMVSVRERLTEDEQRGSVYGGPLGERRDTFSPLSAVSFNGSGNPLLMQDVRVGQRSGDAARRMSVPSEPEELPLQRKSVKISNIVQRRRWQWNGADWDALPLQTGERESPPPDKPGRKRGQVCDTATTAARLSQVHKRYKKDNKRRRTRPYSYMRRALSRTDGIPVPTPYSGEDDIPQLKEGWGYGRSMGPYITGKNQPKKWDEEKNKWVASTSYETIARALDSWCENQEDPAGVRGRLADELIEFLREPGDIVHSRLFDGDDGVENARRAAPIPIISNAVNDDNGVENARRAANYLAAILVAAETHESRKNPDGGKFARAALELLKKDHTFWEVFGDSANAIFIQARKKGNEKFVSALKRDHFDEEIVLSDSSDEEGMEEEMVPAAMDSVPEGFEEDMDEVGCAAVDFDFRRNESGMPESFGGTAQAGSARPEPSRRVAPRPQTNIKQIFKLPGGLNRVGDTGTPPELLQLQGEWQQMARDYLEEYAGVEEIGERVEKAAFVFRYQEEKCMMPIDMVEYCFCWECSIDVIRERLYQLGAQDVVFYPGLRTEPRRIGGVLVW